MVEWTQPLCNGNLLYEVIFLKKIISCLLAVTLCFSLNAFVPKGNTALKIQGAGVVNTISSGLNIRSSPSQTSTIVASVPKNSYITLISESGNYRYVEYANGRYGYCHTDYVNIVSENIKSVKTSNGRLRVRSSASLNSSIIGYLTSGSFVTVISESGNFSKILYNGNSLGYVYSDYLNTVSTETAYKSVKLNIENFKQTDSRWANVTLGSSGQSMAKIGCATTALAMTESYRTGSKIYPNDMSEKLAYTSGGAVYWPSNYKTITSSSEYLSKIYALLKEGKPVILGCKKSDGSQHYVVITGVKSVESLSTSAFYINDPGSNSRTTLNQFISVYPIFYKILHY